MKKLILVSSLILFINVFGAQESSFEKMKNEAINDAIEELENVKEQFSYSKEIDRIDLIINELKENKINLNSFEALKNTKLAELILYIKKPLLPFIKSQEIKKVYEENRDIQNFAWSPDGKKIATINCYKKIVIVYDVKTFQKIAELDYASEILKNINIGELEAVNFLEWSKNSQEILFYANNYLIIWDINKNYFVIKKFEKSSGLFLSPNQSKLASIYTDKIHIFDVTSGDLISSFNNNEFIINIVWLNEKELAFYDLTFKRLKVLNTKNNKIILDKMLTSNISNFICLIKNNILIATTENLEFWSKITNRFSNQLNYPRDTKLKLCDFSVEKELVYVTKKHGLSIRDLDTQEVKRIYENSLISKCKWSPDSRYLAALTFDGTFLIWKKSK